MYLKHLPADTHRIRQILQARERGLAKSPNSTLIGPLATALIKP